ncbi:MAG TPA: hypothetical protein VK881_15090 [bacterium]|nr:hypothetical protein [bacterium]
MVCWPAAFFHPPPPPARAASSPAADRRLDVRLGFGGIVKIGVPLPLEVVLPPLPASGPAEMVIDAPALGPQAGQVVTTTAVPFESVADTVRVIGAPVVISDPRRPLNIRVMVRGQKVLGTSVAVSPERVGGRVVVALSDDRTGLAALHRLPGRVAVAYVTAEALPRRWQEYAAVDLLVIRDLDPAALDVAQQEALLRWVRAGGRLLLVVRPAAAARSTETAGSPGGRAPVFPAYLDSLLPADVGPIRALSSAAGLAAQYGGTMPSGPLTVATLLPRAGAGHVDLSGVPVIASADPGMGAGQVMIWGFDPWRPPLIEWSGRLRLWEEALGREPAPRLDMEGLAEHLAAGTPLDPAVHAQVFTAILLYIALLLGLRRWTPTVAGAAGALLIVLAALGAFPVLAEIVRDRSATLAQVTIIEPVGAGSARATTVAVVAVPYGGRYRVTATPAEMLAEPLTPASDLRVVLGRAGSELTGVLRSGDPPRPFLAVGAIPLSASAVLSRDGRSLAVDLSGLRAGHVELRWGDRLYPLADLPAGRTVRELRPDGWTAVASGGRSSSEWSARVADVIFQGSGADAILKSATPVLAAELDGLAPVFTLGGVRAPGRRLTVLLVPLERR